MDTPFVVLLGVMLLARAGLKRDVPMSAFYLASVACAMNMIWAPISGSLDWILSTLGVVHQYSAPPSALSLVNLVVTTVSGLALLIAVLIAAKGTDVEPPKA